MIFGPFGGADQAGLLCIPEAVDDGTLRAPALLQQDAEGAGLFQQHNGSGNGVTRAVDPGVVMIAADNPLVGVGCPWDAGNHVIDGLGVPVETELEMNFGGAGSRVIRDGETAAPAFGNDWTGERGE